MCPLGLYCLINVGYVLFFLLAAKEDKRCALEEIDDDEEKRKQTVDIPWILDLSHGKLSEKRKDVARERKQKWIFKYTSDDRFDRLIKMCADKLGVGKTVNVFGQLGRETGVKEYNTLIKMCVKKARATVFSRSRLSSLLEISAWPFV